MRKRKNRVYCSKVHLGPVPTFGTLRPASKAESTFSARHRIPRNSARSIASSRPILRSVDRRDGKTLIGAETLRKQLFLVSALTALINICSSAAGCYAVCVDKVEERWETAIFTAIWGSTIVEIALLWVYWSLAVRITDAQSAALSVQFVSSPSLFRSPATLGKCLLECFLHLFAPIPGLQFSQNTYLFGIDITFKLNDYLVLATLLRNYHLLRAFYWFSQFSSIRTLMYARITTVSSQGGFIFRCCLAAYKFTLIVLIYGAMVLLGGIIQTVLERELSQDKTLWSGLWVVAYTQGTIGYGDEAPLTFPAQASTIVNVLLGSTLMGLLTTIISDTISLNLKEFQYCSYLLSARYKRKDTLVVVVVIQSWWRLITSRIRRQPHGPSIVHFYSTLRKFRAILVRCNTIKSGLFQNQVTVIGNSIGASIRNLNMYLYAAKYVRELV